MVSNCGFRSRTHVLNYPHSKGTKGSSAKHVAFTTVQLSRPVELIGPRAFGSLIMWDEAMHHGIYEIPSFGPLLTSKTFCFPRNIFNDVQQLCIYRAISNSPSVLNLLSLKLLFSHCFCYGQ